MMSTSALTETVTVRDLLYGDAPVEPTQALADSLQQSGTVSNLVARFPGVSSLVEGEVAKEIDGLLSQSVLDLAVDGWKKFTELMDAARRTGDNPAAREAVKLVTHRIEFSHPWTVEVLVNGKSAGTLEVELAVSLDIDVVVLVVQRGRITAIESGRCFVTAALEIAQTEVVKRQGRFNLGGEIPLGRGLMLAEPTATAASADGAVVTNAQSPSANWYPDPLRRYEFRRWDGTRWTDQASTKGRVVSDPIVGEHVPRPCDATPVTRLH